MATLNETSDRIAARKAAETILALVGQECVGRSLVFTQRLWTLIQEQSVKSVGLPKRTAIGVEPMNDATADKFREREVTFGKHAGLTVEEIQQRDPDYLAFLVDGNEFTKELRRYLARSKFNQDEDD